MSTTTAHLTAHAAPGTHSPVGSPTRRRAPRALVAALVALAVLAFAPAASAFTSVRQSSGAPYVEPSTVVVNSTNIGTPHSAQWAHTAVNNGPVVYRTTGSTGSQSVQVTFVA